MPSKSFTINEKACRCQSQSLCECGKENVKSFELKIQITKMVCSIQSFSRDVFKKTCSLQEKKIPTQRNI